MLVSSSQSNVAAGSRATLVSRSATTSYLRASRFSSDPSPIRSEEHTSELQSLMRISYAVFCLHKKTHDTTTNTNHTTTLTLPITTMTPHRPDMHTTLDTII